MSIVDSVLGIFGKGASAATAATPLGGALDAIREAAKFGSLTLEQIKHLQDSAAIALKNAQDGSLLLKDAQLPGPPAKGK